MTKPTVDDLLTGSRPRFESSVATEAALDALVLQARDARPAATKRHALWLMPAAMLTAGALTAGAIVVDQYLHVDVPIAIEYTTDTGVTVACTVQIEGASFFSPQPAEVMNYYKNHNFTGTGQKIYDYALVLTKDRQGTRALLPKSVDWLPDDDFVAYSDKTALNDSMVSFLLLDVVIDLGLGGTSGDANLSSDCTGQLH